MILVDITSWWADKVLFEQIFWAFAIPSTAIFIIMLILTFAIGDFDQVDGDVDIDLDADEGIGFQFFTVKNLVSFFTIFGWVGIGMIDMGYSQMVTMAISSVSGIFMMVLMATIFYLMSKLVEDGTMKTKNAIGKLGEVYIIVPKKGNGLGRIQLNVQGSMREMEAMTNDEEDLLVGKIVKVLNVVDQHILVVTSNNNLN
tara:strand:- start:81947 stop:82546 length:600 start_codon:yes stop_codon:yes gene_type:complete